MTCPSLRLPEVTMPHTENSLSTNACEAGAEIRSCASSRRTACGCDCSCWCPNWMAVTLPSTEHALTAAICWSRWLQTDKMSATGGAGITWCSCCSASFANSNGKSLEAELDVELGCCDRCEVTKLNTTNNRM